MTRNAASALILGVAMGLSANPAPGAEPPKSPGTMIYQLRTYKTAPGKLGVLVDRFREHNLELFRRHGIALVGAGTPHDSGEKGRLVYLVAFPDRAAADAAWKGFSDDPEWKKVFAKEKEAHGTVVTKVETVYLTPTDYIPTPDHKPDADAKRVFELRTYVAAPGKLDALHARFRDHTNRLFKKHAMEAVGYWVPLEEKDGKANTLIYVLAFPSREAAKASWDAFRADPEWQKARAESERDGKLVDKVTSVFLDPTDFSPAK